MYESIGGEINKFALTSMYNYLYSVLSVLKEKNYVAFKNERIAIYSGKGLKQITLDNNNSQFLFEQFFFAYKLMNNIKFLSEQSDEVKIPFIELGGMAFYYASYSLAACFIYLNNKNILSTHAKTYKNYNNVCEMLAFPFNLTGRHTDGSCSEFNIVHGQDHYSKGFNYDAQALRRAGMDGFDYKSTIWSYLKGTHRWYWWYTGLEKKAKKEINKAGYKNFGSLKAREIRDRCFSSLPDANYLSCLYRIRGKVNYRDSLFSLYNLADTTEFNSYKKGAQLLEIMLEILKYFSIDIECYFKIKIGMNKFHEEMLSDMVAKTSGYNHCFPEFQKKIFYG